MAVRFTADPAADPKPAIQRSTRRKPVRVAVGKADTKQRSSREVRVPGAKYSVGRSPERKSMNRNLGLAAGGGAGLVGGLGLTAYGVEAGRSKPKFAGAGLAAGGGAAYIAGITRANRRARRVVEDEGLNRVPTVTLHKGWAIGGATTEMRMPSKTVPGRGIKAGVEQAPDRAGRSRGYGQHDRNGMVNQKTTRVVARTPSGKYASTVNDLQTYTITPKHRRDSRLEHYVKKSEMPSSKMPAAARHGRRLPR